MPLLRRSEVLKRFPVCARQIDILEARGLFPKRVKLNPENGRAVAWDEEEIESYIAGRLAAREDT